jgi:hypothetical protein
VRRFPWFDCDAGIQIAHIGRTLMGVGFRFVLPDPDKPEQKPFHHEGREVHEETQDKISSRFLTS